MYASCSSKVLNKLSNLSMLYSFLLADKCDKIMLSDTELLLASFSLRTFSLSLLFFLDFKEFFIPAVLLRLIYLKIEYTLTQTALETWILAALLLRFRYRFPSINPHLLIMKLIFNSRV